MDGRARPRSRAGVHGPDAALKKAARDLELAFYGAEDLTPSGFHSRDDAPKARDGARLTVRAVSPHV
jgi:hypothetical protein